MCLQIAVGGGGGETFSTRLVLKNFVSEGQRRVMQVVQERLHYCGDKGNRVIPNCELLPNALNNPSVTV